VTVHDPSPDHAGGRVTPDRRFPPQRCINARSGRLTNSHSIPSSYLSRTNLNPCIDLGLHTCVPRCLRLACPCTPLVVVTQLGASSEWIDSSEILGIDRET